MRRAHFWIAPLVTIALFAVAGGCKKAETSSADDPNKPHEQTPKEYFVASVFPHIAGANACGACHSGGDSPCVGGSCAFLDPMDANAAYSKIEKTVGYISAPQKSPLLIYQHMNRADGREKLTGDQANVLGIWLGMEATVRHLPGAVAKARSLQEAYSQFAACMNFDVFVGTGMGNLAFMETDFDGPCSGCHSKGQAGVWLASDPTLTFESMKKFPYIQKFVVGRVDSNGDFKDLIPAGRIIDKAREACPMGADGCHPQFGVSDQMKGSIELFVNLTLQNLGAQTCQNGIVTDMTPDGGVR